MMLKTLFKKFFKSKSDRDRRRMQPIIENINEFAEAYQSLSVEDLKAKTAEFRQRIADDESLEDLLPEAFAVVKETCRRHAGQSWPVCGREIEWNMVPYDVQLVGAISLHEGSIAEMATGEGKTLVATMPLYLNALTGRGAVLVTVNDYLARRDGEWMGEILRYLGLTIGIIQNGQNPSERAAIYACDVVYGTNNEIGFDYLRDNMATRIEDRVHRPYDGDVDGKHFYYAIIDEVDSVLVDEARTPLIIAGPVPESTTGNFVKLKPGIEQLVRSQQRMVTDKINEVSQVLNDGIQDLSSEQEYDLGFKLLEIRRASPKHKQFLKIVAREGSLQKIIKNVESALMRDKILHSADEDLYFSIDEKSHIADLTELGREELARRINLPLTLPDLSVEMKNIEDKEQLTEEEKTAEIDTLYKEYALASDSIHDIGQLLKAYQLFEKDVEYVVQEGKVMIVDEFTGRLMPGRRFSDGLHQALEAKENVRVEKETQTMATITLQNLFRMYEVLAGMTGTAETEAEEFKKIYNLDVMVIPTHRVARRLDFNDQIYRSKREKYNAVIEEIARQNGFGMPLLVGTVSVEVSELLSRMLKRKGIVHEVLNAKNHQREAEIVTNAGRQGAVTIATNMAGRGTDIKLGEGVLMCERDPGYTGKRCASCPFTDDGKVHSKKKKKEEEEKDFVDTCGLQIIGTERHESRRIDRQLRGRSGRQGDPGSSRFYMSLEDDLMRLFNPERIASVMDRIGIEDGEVITAGMVTKAVERAQKRVEFHNFDQRQHLLKYDDVMNKQREVIYENRLEALGGTDLHEAIRSMVQSFVETLFDTHCPEDGWPDDVNLDALQLELQSLFLRPFDLSNLADMGRDAALEHVLQLAQEILDSRETTLTPDIMRQLERYAHLRAIDDKWKDHLRELDHLRTGISLQAYAQKDPLLEYKSEAFKMFEEMLYEVDKQTLHILFHAQVSLQGPAMERAQTERLSPIHAAAGAPGGRSMRGPAPPPLGQPGRGAGYQTMGPGGQGTGSGKPVPVRNSAPKVGRNEQCPCGSGKKYKFCHGSA